MRAILVRLGLAVTATALLAGCGPVTLATPTPAASGSASRIAALSVPDVTGKRLNEAEAVLQGAGIKTVKTTDATGQGRIVIDPNNWFVRHQTPAEGTKIAVGDPVTLDVAKPTDGVGPSTVAKGVVPNVVCMDLQAAQDTLQSAGFYLLSSKDALGDRHQILDRDWVVIGQSAAAGSTAFPTTKITLTVVKYGEPTGESGCHS
ncbi:PASTA domain-containing protein [Hamadaea tsunoensis]|uniref:PASTA domain-containing protein n=1 Tax=Hamadaea tsunoensis TaxID=53368 RepID=UPI00146FC608|nr:PASTA domain-containing protein [Hamadaea tsunoensis]